MPTFNGPISRDSNDDMSADYERRARAHLDALIVTAERALSQAVGESLGIYSSDSAVPVTLQSLYTMCTSIRRWNSEP
jgi:hypothetical protein